jgi:hypothetical protein
LWVMIVVMRRLQSAMLVFVVCAIILECVAWGQSLSGIVDEPTGIRLSVPLDWLVVKKRTKWGTNWQAPGNRLSVDTLDFGHDRSLGEVHATLSKIKGRQFTVNVLNTQRFVLEGTDSDGTFFHVLGAEWNGAVRVLSIVFSERSSSALVRSIVNSFTPFPGTQPDSQTALGPPSKPTAHFAEPAICHLADNAGSVRATSIDVRVKRGAGQIRTGDPITVEWKATSGINLGCRTPLYLVLTTPMRTRFEGEKFLALPPRAEGPFRITYGSDRTRIFVPLHLGTRQNQGQVIIKVYETGPLLLDWALIEVPRHTKEPQTKEDLAIGHERGTARVALGREITVIPGNPAIVVRDHLSTDTPIEVLRSNSGEFELQVFDRFYRVLDAKSGELLHERAGLDPNFTPTSRFLGAYSAGPGFEIIDLYSGQVVTSNDILHRERGFKGNVHMAAWSPGDAILALSIQGWGGIEVQQSLVDSSHRSFPNTSCHYCRGIGSALRVDIEAGIVSFQGQETGWASLFDRTVGTAAANTYAFAQVPEQAGESERWDEKLQVRRESIKQTTASRMLAQLAQAGFFRPQDFLAGFDPDKAVERIEENWRFPGQMRLSHLCLESNDGKCVGRIVDWQEATSDPEDDNTRLAKMRVAHKASSSPIRASFDDRLIGVRETISRHGNDRASMVWSRLGDLLSKAKADATLSKISRGVSATDATKGNERVAAAVVRAIPKAGAILRAASKGDFIEPKDVKVDTYYGLKSEAKFIEPRAIRQAANWHVGDRSYWLIRPFFDYGASSRNWLFLLYGTKNGPSRLVDLTHRLRQRVGKNPSGLDEHGNVEITEEFATTMGFGGWPSSFDTASIAFDRYLIASGFWTIDSRRWVLVYDLASDQIRFFNRDVPEAATVTEFAVTEEGRTLVQVNSNGHLYFYDVGSEKLLLRGVDIDDELVVYDAHGYYAASPEGAQFVFLKFPGFPGYNSFHQFARTLHRPDLIQAVLAGKLDTPDPLLTSPPRVNVEVQVAGAGSNRIAHLKLAAASSIGLEKVKVFVDGRQASEYAVVGHAFNSQAAVPLLNESRWITTVAIDVGGYESVPESQELAGYGTPAKARVFAVAVGTDQYDDKSIAPLQFAKTDANNFARGLKTLEGVAYSKVEVAPLLDASGLQSALPDKIRELVARAGEQDTIMLFASGHGFRDPSTGRFYLVTRDTRRERVTETSISWAEIAKALDGAKARVFVLLDACQSGAAADGGSNDDAVTALLSQKASITVIAAAKGRQYSLELGTGGAFTTALVRAITEDRKATDTNNNGAIELAELYGAVKRQVVTKTGGKQTPWIARNLMLGETPLF